jgi:uncharacterized protein with von Willebrand factor type A (vWA) domain
MDDFREFCQNEGLGDMIKGVGNYFSKTNYDDEYYKLPQQLKDIYDKSPNIRKYVGQLKKDKVIPLAAAIQTYMQEREPAMRLAALKNQQGPERKAYGVKAAPFEFGQHGNNPGWKRYQ